MLDKQKKYFYFFISTYNTDVAEQGVSIARMRYADRDNPVGKVFKYCNGQWTEPGLKGHVTPIFNVTTDWYKKDADAFWGPSIHYNTYLKQYVMLLNRAINANWDQEGAYISFNPDLADTQGWSEPVKIVDAAEFTGSKWYPQIIGTDKAARETDKRAGKTARLFVAGSSKWELVFLKPGEVDSH